MAELNPIGFRPGTSRLHRLDARFKIGALALVGMAASLAAPTGLILLSALILAAVLDVRLELGRLFAALNPFLIMLALVALVRAWMIPGDPIFSAGWFSLSRQGAVEGGVFVWRILMVVLGGALFTATTRSWAVRAAVAWCLRPLPGIPARRAATMMGLLVRFIPEILQQAAETRDAQRARGIEACCNPVRRLSVFSIGLMRRTLLRADRLTLAMEARCYTEARVDPPLEATGRDAACIAAVGLACLAAVLL